MSVINVDMVDTISATVDRIPRNTRKVAGYTTGTPDIAWTSSDWDRFNGDKVKIDQSNSTHPLSGDVKDVENGAATIATAVEWAKQRHALGLRSTIYISQGSLQECEAAVNAAGLSAVVFYWLADWNLSHEQAISFLGGRIVAVQWASPTSNPHTLLPGTNITLAQANADLSVTVSWWMAARKPKRHIPIPKPKPPHIKVVAGLSAGGVATGLAAVFHSLGVSLTPAEWTAIGVAITGLAAHVTPSKK